ncbi:flavoprotein-like protein [Lipomyces kononenkoae]|uniref:Flavoprotein-like protein n=1 Tax=Lipomyces kononenkoae TaxID=34357 RepID=A0ACC3T518_LIPKO
MAPKVAIVIYSMYGHTATLAEAEKAGIEKAGGSATIYQIPETLSEDVLTKMHAPPKPDYPIASASTLTEYDAFLFGVPTRYGNFPGQWKAFWDTTGSIWAKGGLAGKYVGQFVAGSSPGGGQEVTVLNSLSTYVHHGLIFSMGHHLGAGTFSCPDGSRQPTNLEKETATIQGETFYNIVAKAFN